MSFILDALKKAESERNRNSGPVLMVVRVAAPRRRLPTWAWVLGAVLLANLGVLGWLLLRPAAPAEIAATPAPAATAPAVVAPPSVQPSVPPAAAPATAPAAAPPFTPALPPLTGGDILPPVNATAARGLVNLPSAQDLRAAGVALPALQLNLHVYDASPLRRYVLLNGLRLGEGEFTPDGVKVEQITPEGVVLDAVGRRFLLSAGG
jgi:general secretion pathway protein B